MLRAESVSTTVRISAFRILCCDQKHRRMMRHTTCGQCASSWSSIDDSISRLRLSGTFLLG